MSFAARVKAAIRDLVNKTKNLEEASKKSIKLQLRSEFDKAELKTTGFHIGDFIKAVANEEIARSPTQLTNS